MSLYVVMREGTFLRGPGDLVTEWRECQVRDSLERAVAFCENRQRIETDRGAAAQPLRVMHEGVQVWPC